MAHSSLFNHVKLKRLASRLSVSRPTALGHLAYLWNYAGDCRMDGSLTGLQDEDIELAAEWEGKAGAFVEACIGSGFIDRDNDGTRIHDWDDWCPEYVKKRRSRRKDKGLRSKTADNGCRAADNGRHCLPNGGQRLPEPGRAEPSRENTPKPPLPQAAESPPPDDAIGETPHDIPADPGPPDDRPLTLAIYRWHNKANMPTSWVDEAHKIARETIGEGAMAALFDAEARKQPGDRLLFKPIMAKAKTIAGGKGFKAGVEHGKRQEASPGEAF